MDSLQLLQNNIINTYKNRLSLYLGCYKHIDNLDRMGDVENLFFRHGEIFNTLEIYKNICINNIKFGMNNPEIAKKKFYIENINDVVNTMKSIDKNLVSSQELLFIACVCLDADYYYPYNESKSLLFQIKEDGNSKNVNYDILINKLDESSIKIKENFDQKRLIK